MSDTRCYVIADTHFGHRKIIEFERAFRPFRSIEEHDRELVARWNAVVRPRDIVWHLGDAVFGRENVSILGCLNGHKRLVMGNHDQYDINAYAVFFERICGVAEKYGAILTHVPVADQQRHRYLRNVHGHMHSKKMEDPWYACVSAEHTGLAPVRLDHVVRGVA